MKRIVFILSLLVTGVVVNTGIAWTLAYAWHAYSKEQSVSGEVSGDDTWSAYRDFGLGTDRAVLMRWRLSPPADAESVMIDAAADGLPWWSRQREQIRQGTAIKPQHLWFEFAYGWPIRAYSCGINRGVVQDGWELSRSPRPADSTVINNSRRFIPLRPIWTGQIVNTVFYAVVLLLMILGLRRLRRHIRCRRGLCPTCAYDLRGGSHSACPECGQTVPQ